MHNGYRVVVGIATMQGRQEHFANTMESLEAQTVRTDAIHVYNNARERVNLTDNGKFFGLLREKEPCYYLTCDDDIIYPDTYVADMLKSLDKNGGIVTHHGRILNTPCQSYYSNGSTLFHFQNSVTKDVAVDVAGTGVSAWHTSYFNPTSIVHDKRQRMTDCLFSLLAATEGIPITQLKHRQDYFISQWVNTESTIYGAMKNKDHEQARIANLILHLKNENNSQ